MLCAQPRIPAEREVVRSGGVSRIEEAQLVYVFRGLRRFELNPGSGQEAAAVVPAP
jgi:hypothetical protein